MLKRTQGSLLRRAWARLKKHPLARIGPGLITGVADDDPSGIATYSQAGAQFGLNMLWTMPLAFPLMSAIQYICASIGRVTGKGLAANIKDAFPPLIIKSVVLLLLVANTLNIAADVAAMGEVAELISGYNRHLMTTVFVIVTLLLQIFVAYHRYVRFLKWLTLSLLAYAAVLFTVHVPWGEVMLRTVWPHFTPNATAAAVVVGVFGTTISPYLFFWQAAQEVEDTKAEPVREPLRRRPSQGPDALARIQLDTIVGMAISNLVALAILATTAATLHAGGVHDLTSAAQAAEALRPIAGRFAFALFALGIIGTGLLSVPVLAGSAAYALGEARRWPVGLSRQPLQAKAFYATITAATLMGAAANVLSISPVKALVWSAVVNAIVAVPVMALLMRMATNVKILGDFTISRAWSIIGWLATGVMAIASIVFMISLLLPRA